MDCTQDSDITCPSPTCILCNEVLQNISMAPAKLNLHFETKHSERKGKTQSYFQITFKKLSPVKIYRHKIFKSEKENAVMASMKVISGASLEDGAHTVGGKLFKKSAIVFSAFIKEREAAGKIQLMSLLEKTI
jgi:hypothetical protein